MVGVPVVAGVMLGDVVEETDAVLVAAKGAAAMTKDDSDDTDDKTMTAMIRTPSKMEVQSSPSP